MQKPFSLYHEIEFKYHKKTSVFLAMNVREQFQFVPSKWFPLDTLIQMKKLQRVPLVHVIRESVHRASASKKSTPKRSWVLCEITDKGTHPTWRTGAWWWRSGGSDAIWFTGGPPPKNIACYTWVYRYWVLGVEHAFQFNTLWKPRRITCFSI